MRRWLSSMKSKYYAVRCGRSPGVYSSWPACQAQVTGFSGAVYKSFPTEAQAWEFIGECPTAPAAPSLKRPRPEEIVSSSLASSASSQSSLERVVASSQEVDQKVRFYQPNIERMVVYTDGACSGNGSLASKAGYGVYFGDDDPRNIAGRLPGKQTNQRAELWAAKACLQSVDPSIPLEIRTDSKYTIGTVTEWMPKLFQDSAEPSAQKRAKYTNYDLMKELYELTKNRDVTWVHIRGHQGIHGNEMADELARQGCEKSL